MSVHGVNIFLRDNGARPQVFFSKFIILLMFNLSLLNLRVHPVMGGFRILFNNLLREKE